MVPSNEQDDAERQIRNIGECIDSQVDLDTLINIGAGSPAPDAPDDLPCRITPLDSPLTIGIARDQAFGFYYPGDLDAMHDAGATLIEIDTLSDSRLPEIDGLFIGGGFPESNMQALEKNQSLRTSIHDAIENGLAVYAECGGLMYLARTLRWGDIQCEMVGSIPADCIMHTRPQGRGYVKLQAQTQHPWGDTAAATPVYAHEFHYSGLTGLGDHCRYAYKVLRGSGINGSQDGFIYKNLLACYTHSAPRAVIAGPNTFCVSSPLARHNEMRNLLTSNPNSKGKS